MSAVQEASQNIAYLDKTVSTFDPRYTLKVLRTLPALRKQVDAAQLGEIIGLAYESDPEYAKLFANALKVDLPKANSEESTTNSASKRASVSPEVDAYVHLLAQVWLLNSGRPDAAEQLYLLSQHTLKRVQQYNQRSLDYIIAKIWFYYERAAELSNKLSDPEVYASMMKSLRTATLRHDHETQAMLITLILRLLATQNHVSEASNLVAKTTFPESHASNSLAARYYYWLARINAVQLDYSTAHEQITAAIRKVPQTYASAGFVHTATKLGILIDLLMGEIPERRAASPYPAYLALVRAVRAGDVTVFQKVLEEHGKVFAADGSLNLAKRLRQNVIKTGIRVLSLTYSRISLKDVCIKLCLDSEESAEYIVAKAIRDGVIDAEINHQKAYMQSREFVDIYSTTEPQQQFHDRIKFCMALHDDSVKSMRYLSADHRADLKDAQEAREREKELVTEIQEGTDLEDDDADFEL